MATLEAPRQSARERLLDAADELFYAEGVNVVGIDRIIERAGVAKASLYNCYGSKDELVRAYLRRRAQLQVVRLETAIAKHRSPRRRLLAVFDAQAEWMARPTYNGCAFYGASSQSAEGSAAREGTREYRAILDELLVRLCREAGARRPAELAAQLHLVYDGAAQAGRTDPTAASSAARAAAAALVDAAV